MRARIVKSTDSSWSQHWIVQVWSWYWPFWVRVDSVRTDMPTRDAKSEAIEIAKRYLHPEIIEVKP